MTSLLLGDPLLALRLPLLPCLDGYLLRSLLAACETDSPRAGRFIYGQQNREDPVLELCVDMVDIDEPGEGDRPFKRAGGYFLQEPVVPLPVAVRLALHPVLLGLALLLRRRSLRLTCLPLLLSLHLSLGLLLMLVLIAVATSNCQAVLINHDFDIFRSAPGTATSTF